VINVEVIGGSLLVQHYIEEICEPSQSMTNTIV